MWFGDKVTCASAEDMWLNEGWARWCEILFTEMLYGQEAADAYFKDLHYSVLRYTHTTDGGFRALSPMPQEYTYGSTVYDKGGIVAHTLRHYMGDSLFFAGVQNYLSQYAYDDADSYQLKGALEEASGMDLGDFFDFFVFTPGFTHYSVDSFNLIPTCGNYRAVVYMKQKLRGTDTYADNCRVDLTFMDRSGNKETYQVNFPGIADSVIVPITLEPVLVMPDFYYRLADATTDEAKTIGAPGTYDFENTFCKVNVVNTSDSAFIRVTHDWVAPDSLFVPQEGLTLSTSHYWSIDGILPGGFSAKGIFSYNRNLLDGDILTNANDSLVILYRQGTAYDWQPVNFTQTGPWQLGTLTVDNLQPGQYTLAVWDEMYVGTTQLLLNEKLLHLFPNPAKDTFTIQTGVDVPSRLVIHNASGRLVHEQKISKREEVRWHGDPGTYIITLYNGNKKIATAKGVIK
ncbi:MAG TPA: M1 family aminopeptidase, partial [Lentimicrobium sp.]|nr:M1 family aminopeptidase [Lentimicrobium sp.]